MGLGHSSTTTKILRHFVIDNPKQLLEYTNRLYRVSTKDHLTIQVYTLCKNIIEKILFFNKLNVSIDEFHNEIISKDYRNRKLRLNLTDNIYDIPLDFYLRSIILFIEKNKLIDNLELFMMNKIFNVSQNISKQCLNNMKITIHTEIVAYISEQISSYDVQYNGVSAPNMNESSFQTFAKNFILQNMNCEYNVIKLNIIEHGKDIGHATVLFVENRDNEMNFFLYDPHGYAAASFTTRYNIHNFLEEFVNKLNESNLQQKIFNGVIKFKETNLSCLRGIQRYTNDYDIGLCSLFRLVWLYFVINITIELKKISISNNVKIPKIEEWVYMIDEFFTTQLKPIEAYYVIILFTEYLINQYMTIDRRFIDNMLLSPEFINYIRYNEGELDISRYIVSTEKLLSEKLGRNLSKKEIQQELEYLKNNKEKRSQEEKRVKQEIYNQLFKEIEELENKLDDLNDKDRRELEQYILKREEQLEEEYNKRISIYEQQKKKEDEYIELVRDTPLYKREEYIKKIKEDDDEDMEEDYNYEQELLKEQEEEKYYKQQFFLKKKKKVLEECDGNNDECISGCCDFSKSNGKFFCQPKPVCKTRSLNG